MIDPAAAPDALPGIGAAARRQLAGAGITTITRLLHVLPSPAAAMPPVISGTVTSARVLRFGRRANAEIRIRDSTGTTWILRYPGAAWMTKKIASGAALHACGEPRGHMLIAPKLLSAPDGRLPPVYDPPAGISSGRLARWIGIALTECGGCPDPFDTMAADAYLEVLAAAHRGDAAARTLIEERLVAACLAAARLSRERQEQRPGRSWRSVAPARLPIAPRPSQAAAAAAIAREQAQPWPMLHLLTGEVGSGKTVVMALAAHAVLVDQGQVVLAAPTTLLAQQLRQRLAAWLAPVAVRLWPADRDEALRESATRPGPAVWVGAHAILTDRPPCPQLGLVMIDEQHRFGTAIRAAGTGADDQGYFPDVLQISATPIPRTLAQLGLGGISCSTISAAPRQVPTTIRPRRSWSRSLPVLVRDTRADGRRCLIICPSRSSEERGLISVEQVSELLRSSDIPGVAACSSGDIDATDLEAPVIVATTVVEVGIDLPDIGLVAVVGAERFGLAQLHQIRGRAGRDGGPAACHLFAEDPQGRLAPLSEDRDGLALAEADLRQRGGGDPWGLRQHGVGSIDLVTIQERAEIAGARLTDAGIREACLRIAPEKEQVVG